MDIPHVPRPSITRGENSVKMVVVVVVVVGGGWGGINSSSRLSVCRWIKRALALFH